MKTLQNSDKGDQAGKLCRTCFSKSGCLNFNTKAVKAVNINFFTTSFNLLLRRGFTILTMTNSCAKTTRLSCFDSLLNSTHRENLMKLSVKPSDKKRVKMKQRM